MAKEVKFNIKLNIDGKNVVIDCKNNVRQLGDALNGVTAKTNRVNEAWFRLSSVSTLMRNGMDGIRQLGSDMQPFIDKANADTDAINKSVAAQTQLGINGFFTLFCFLCWASE